MIKKQLTITSLAILIAAISVATTMTMVQADTTGDDVDINIPTATPTDEIDVVIGGGPPEYIGTIGVAVDAKLSFVESVPPNKKISDKAELTITNPGSNVPNGTFIFPGNTNGEVIFTDGDGNGILDGTLDHKDELFIDEDGVNVADFEATLAAVVHPITVDITGGPGIQTVEIDLTAGSPDTNDIVVTIDDIQWLGETGAIGSFGCSSSVGANTAPLFDKDTLEITISGVVIDQTIDIICEFEGFHGDVEKDLTGDCDVEIKEFITSPCMFTITYSGVRANVIDTVPAEWKVTAVTGNEVDAKVTFTDGSGGGVLNTFIDPSKLELVITNPGFNVPTGGVFTFPNTIPIPALDGLVLFTDGLGAGTVDGTIDDIDELTVLFPGGLVGSPFTATITATPFDTCADEPSNKKLNNKSSTQITCDDVTDVNSKVNVETRESPGKGHKKQIHGVDIFKPTFCTGDEKLFINDGAKAILLDSSGEVVFSTLGIPIPIVLDFTDPVEIIVGASEHFDCEGEHITD